MKLKKNYFAHFNQDNIHNFDVNNLPVMQPPFTKLCDKNFVTDLTAGQE